MLLIAIDEILKCHGKSLQDFTDLPQIDTSVIVHHTSKTNNSICETFDPNDQLMKADINSAKLNEEQSHVYETIIHAVLNHEGGVYFLDGPGGCGKTFLYNTLLQRVRSTKGIALSVASSGIAAELIDGGRTAHSMFKIPIPVQKDSTCNISRGSALGKLLQITSFIVWDECPMLHKFVYDCVSRSLSDIMECQKPFGGIVTLLGGDFRQILPVIRHAREAEIVESILKRSIIWHKIKAFSLKVNMRAQLAPDQSTAQGIE